MPWRECCKMDERLRFVARLLEGEKMTVLCREFDISRKTGYKLLKFGAAGGIRTPDLLVRSQALYPTELRPRAVKAHIYVGPRADGGELP